MATVIGESGAWREIRLKLGRAQLHVGKPGDIAPLHQNLLETYPASVERRKSETLEAVAVQERMIEMLRGEKGVWRTIRNWFRIRTCNASISLLNWKQDRFIQELDRNIRHLGELQNSAELAGAIAELAVIKQLSLLPGDHVVLNDVHLRSNRYIHYNGNPLQSAQIDHMVLSPAGVFVIETKLWSEKFAQSHAYHNPFDQVQRASYLCYDLLKSFWGKTRVRSVIACGGHLPEAPDKSRVKILPFHRLNGYITWFQKQELSPDKQARLRQYFERFVN